MKLNNLQKPTVPTEKVPTGFDVEESIEYIWDALNCYREDCISGPEYEELWDDIVTSMSWICDQVSDKWNETDD